MAGFTRRRRVHAFVAGAFAACGVACGSHDAFSPGRGGGLAASSHAGGTNHPPVISDLHIEPDQPTVGGHVRAVASVRDAEGDPIQLTYHWTVGDEERYESGGDLDLAGVSKGTTIGVRVTASDGRSDSEPASATVRVIDRAPVMNGIAIAPNRTVRPGDSVVVTPTATDPDGDIVSFDFEWFVNGEPRSNEGPSFSSEGLSSGDRIRVRVTASDGNNASRPFESQDVVVGSANPEIVSSPPGFTDAGVFRYAVEAKDPGGDRNLRYRLATAPDGMRIDEERGVIEWRPSPGQAGVHPVSVVVSNSAKLETTQSFDVTVSASAPAAPAQGSD